MKLLDGQTILFIGDSITDCGRGRPVGMGNELGSGYVSLVNGFLVATDPAAHITVLNTGIGGNRVTDLNQRWQNDVLDIAPDWLSIMIGINDVWRHFDSPNIEQVDISLFENTYRNLLDQTHKGLKGLVLMTPYIIEKDLSDPMRAQMDLYCDVVRKLAGEFDALFVDTQATFDRYLIHRSSQTLSSDRIHPNLPGHMMIAKAFLAEID